MDRLLRREVVRFVSPTIKKAVSDGPTRSDGQSVARSVRLTFLAGVLRKAAKVEPMQETFIDTLQR